MLKVLNFSFLLIPTGFFFFFFYLSSDMIWSLKLFLMYSTCYSHMIIQSFHNSNLIPSIDELVVWRIVDISFVFYYIWRFNLYGLIILDFNISFDWWDNFLEIEFFSEMVGFIMGLGIVFPLSSAFVFL